MKTKLSFKDKVNDMMVMTGRLMRHAFRSVDTLITVIAMPIMMMLLFVYVFGGSIETGSVNYINFLVPGIVIVCIIYGAPYTSVRLNNDISKGIIDRFRSMPIAQSSILTGHVLTSVVFNLISSVFVLLFAFLIGFRTNAGFSEWLLVAGILILFTLAMTWMSVIFGLLAKNAEGAGAFSYPILLMLFVSSAFTPAESMQGIVRLFAENQPMTPIIETVRSLILSGSIGNSALTAVLWCLAILVVSYIAAIQIYKHRFI